MHEDMLSPLRGECDSYQCPWWSCCYDAHPNSVGPGFNPSMRQRIFTDYITYLAPCYTCTGQEQAPNTETVNTSGAIKLTT